jgi:hypothetical protein
VSTLVFLEAVIHNFLYIKGIYPVEAFVNRCLFGISIKSVGENTLQLYIHGFIKSIEDLNNKGILHSLSLLITKNETVISCYTVEIDWLINIYAVADNDKVLSPSSLDLEFSRVLSSILSEPVEKHSDYSFQLLVETMKEEASDYEEVLSSASWQVISNNSKKCSNSASLAGVLTLSYGYS